MPGVTISAAFGTGGASVATAVAESLALPLLDRAIGSDVASALHVTVQEAEEGAPHLTFTERFFAVLAPLASGVLQAGTDAGPPETHADPSAAFREQSESVIRKAIVGGAVILGRGGSAALKNEPGVLRVRLFGPVDQRVRQAMQLHQLTEKAAQAQLHEVDTAREHYVRRLYHLDANDPTLFQLQIDSTALTLTACASLIVAGYRSLISTR